jgi:hypothetical protein
MKPITSRKVTNDDQSRSHKRLKSKWTPKPLDSPCGSLRSSFVIFFHVIEVVSLRYLQRYWWCHYRSFDVSPGLFSLFFFFLSSLLLVICKERGEREKEKKKERDLRELWTILTTSWKRSSQDIQKYWDTHASPGSFSFSFFFFPYQILYFSNFAI